MRIFWGKMSPELVYNIMYRRPTELPECGGLGFLALGPGRLMPLGELWEADRGCLLKPLGTMLPGCVGEV